MKTIVVKYKTLSICNPRLPRKQDEYEELRRYDMDVDNRTIWSIAKKSQMWSQYKKRDDPNRAKFEAYITIVLEDDSFEVIDNETIEIFRRDEKKYAKTK